jgi:competence protein ComEC
MDDPPAVEPLRLRRVPLLAAAACFAAGDAAAFHWLPPALVVAATAASLLLALTALFWAQRVAVVAALGVMAGVGCWCGQMQPPVSQQLPLRQNADGLSRIVRGAVVRVRTLPAEARDPATPLAPQQPWRMEPGAWELDGQPGVETVDLRVSAVEYLTPDISEMRPMAGGVRITLTGLPVPLGCGDVVEVPLRLRVPEEYRDPGAWSYGDELLSEGVGVTATAKSAKLQVLSRGFREWRSGWQCRLYAAQRWAAGRMDAYVASAANAHLPAVARLDAEDAAMLGAMLFGDRSRLTRPLRSQFERTGTFHLFVVSGLHVALLAGAVFWTLRRVRLPQSAAVIMTLLLTTAYALLTGFGVPAQRALAMTAVYLLARWLDREVTALNALGAAALFVLAMDPRSLFEAGFQMTFVVIFAIAGLAEPIRQRWVRPWARAAERLDLVEMDAFLHPRLAAFRVRVRMWGELCDDLLHPRLGELPAMTLRLGFHVVDGLLFGVAAELCMTLPMALYFHRTTLLALPLNLVNIPLLAALLAAGVATFCAGLLSTWMAAVPGAFAAMLLHLMQWTVLHAQRAPVVDLRTPAPGVLAIVLACAAAAIACVALRMRSRLCVSAGLLAAMLVPVAVLLPQRPVVHQGSLEVTALDVGQGDSLLVVGPTGKTLLVDAGGPVGRGGSLAGNDARWDVGEEVVAPYLWSRQLRRLDAVLLTHAHSDHMGGMPAVLRDFRPRELWLSVQPGDAPGLVALLAEAKQLHVTVRWLRAGDGFMWDGVQASVLAPEAAYTNPGVAVNDDSLVMRLDYGKASVLLEGDAEAASEDTMLANGRLDAVTLLKVGHHGSKTSTQPEFLSVVAPKEAVISVGRQNTFGHPRAEVLARLEAAHVQTFRTDREGAETFLLSKDGGIRTVSTAGP